MKKLFVLMWVIFISSCSNHLIDIPNNFTPFNILSGRIGEMIRYSLKVAPPMKLRYGTQLFLPAQSDADLSFILNLKLDKGIGQLKAGSFIPDFNAVLYIRNGSKWISYKFHPLEMKGSFAYITQLVLPYQANSYKMKLEITGVPSKVGRSLLLLLRDSPVVGSSFVREFTFHRSDLL